MTNKASGKTWISTSWKAFFGERAIAKAFISPYKPIPAPILFFGNISASHVDRDTVAHAKPKPLTIRAAKTTHTYGARHSQYSRQ